MAEKAVKRCVIVCASPDADAEFIKSVIRFDDYVIAADGGMSALNKAGIVPSLFVGDFDSYSGALSDNVEVIRLKTRKDDTDSSHCAEIAVQRGYKEVVLLGASGGDTSHTFSNFAVLSYLCDNNVPASMLDKRECIRVLNEGKYAYNGLSGTTFSVFPFGCESVVVSYEGDVEYPADDLEIFENSSLGKSNIFNSDNVNIVIKKGKALVFSSLPD